MWLTGWFEEAVFVLLQLRDFAPFVAEKGKVVAGRVFGHDDEVRYRVYWRQVEKEAATVQ